MNIEIICIGKLKDNFFEDASKEYIKRISGFGKIKITELPQIQLPESPSEKQIQTALQKEAESILKHIPKNSAVYPMCIEGKQLSSTELAEEIKKTASGGQSTLSFIIGGSHGLDDSVKKLGKIKLSMSAMTFPHRLARIMLLEQIYRAFTIIEGKKYHK